MVKGDWVVLPRKNEPTICIAEIVGDYEFHKAGPDPFFHSRKVKWLATEIPRTHFSQDLLYSFGAFMTICRIARNDAEARIRAMARNHWKPEKTSDVIAPHQTLVDDVGEVETDLSVIARDQLARMIKAKFKGHGLAQLVGAILKAQGFEIYISPPGPDGGVDILAGSGAFGFGEMRIAVQVKSEDGLIDLAALKQLKGTMADVKATRGMLVAWGGFKSSVERERATSFFDVRLWNQNDLIEALLGEYDNLDPEIRAELPLKRIWTVAAQDE
ncbi:MAG: restriction endonuclease [Burkholderiales bacterium]